MRVLIGGLVVVVGLLVALGDNLAQEKEKPKHTIKEVMKKAMKGGLCAKVAGGKASDEEKKELVELFTSLTKNTPPKGEAASWKEKTSALLEAATKGDGAALKTAANCMNCHTEHKGKAK